MIRSVATTAVAQPLTMLTALAAIAVRPVEMSMSTGARAGTATGSARRISPVGASSSGGAGMWVVWPSAIGGMGPVGARRMMPVRESSGRGTGVVGCRRMNGGEALGRVGSVG